MLACPDCHGTAWEIELEDDTIRDGEIRLAAMHCLSCDAVIKRKVKTE